MDGELDLSMSDLDEVPMKKIDSRKVNNLDLSNNRLTLLPKTFPTLIRLVTLNLSKNEIKELPEDFGNLIQLRHLDLYSNKLQHIPLSFSKLKSLKWLDLKDNPLVPTLAKVAGPCLDSKQCDRCATDIVNFFVKLEQQVNADLEMRNKTRQKQLEINQQKQRDEKKAKKKEKKKQKQEVQNTQKSENTARSKSKKDNNNKKIKAAPVTTKQVKHSILEKLFTLVLVTCIVLFISTSIKVKCTEEAELLTKKMYGLLLDKVPTDYRTYGVQFGVVIHDFHNRTGETTLKVIQFLREAFPQEKRQRAYDNCTNFLMAVFEKIKATYSSFISR